MIFFANKRISICRDISAAPEDIWNILTDTHLWPLWGPSLQDVECEERFIKSGSSGRVRTIFSFWLPFTVTDLQYLDVWVWNIGTVQATGHKLIHKSDTTCTLCFDMAWWAALYTPICWLALLRIDKIACQHKSTT